MSRLLDKFYTRPEIVAFCYQQLPQIGQFDLIVEPSAGAGAFLKQLPTGANYKAYDIAPESDEIIMADFLTIDPTEIKGSARRILTVGNPPFGRNCSMALKFIKHAMIYSDMVAFILPKSFKKNSLQNRVPLIFSLEKSVDLSSNSFLLDGRDYDVPCVFQIWTRTSTPRSKKIGKTTTNFFQFVSPKEGQLTVRRVGVYAGTAYISIDKSKESHYFIALPESGVTAEVFVERCNSIKWEHNNTAGPRSISKGELIEEMEALLITL